MRVASKSHMLDKPINDQHLHEKMDSFFMDTRNKFENLKAKRFDSNLDISKEFVHWSFWRDVLAASLATMLFVFVGTASSVYPIGEELHTAKIIRSSFTFGLLTTTLLQMFGHVTGGHFNPAVSIAMAMVSKVSATRTVCYLAAQCGGAILGSLILKSVTPASEHGNLGTTSIGESFSEAQAFGGETVFTFILVFSIFGCTDGKRTLFGSPALGIGLTVTVLDLVAVPYTGASMNPARTLGPAIISNKFDSHWVYWVGPLTGACAAAIVYRVIFDPYRHHLSDEEIKKELLCDIDVIVIPKTYILKRGQTNALPGQTIKTNGTNREATYVDKLPKRMDKTEKNLRAHHQIEYTAKNNTNFYTFISASCTPSSRKK